MGFVKKLANKRHLQPRVVQIGPWLSDVRSQIPALEQSDLIALAGTAAALSVNTTRQSGYHAVGMLRSKGDDTGVAVAYGNLDYTVMRPTWQVWASVSENDATVSVPQYLTRDDKILQEELLDDARMHVVARLSNGPGDVHFKPGVPDMEPLVKTLALPTKLALGHIPMDGDRLRPVPPEFGKGFRIPIMAADVPAVGAAMTSLRMSTPADATADAVTVSLSGGRANVTSQLGLSDGPDGAFLEIHLGGESGTGAQRTFRAAVTFLALIASSLESTVPARAAISEAVAFLEARASEGEPYTAWDASTPAAAVEVRAASEGEFPVGMFFRTRGPHNLQSLVRAQSWLVCQAHPYERGLRKATRDRNRFEMRRGPQWLSNGELRLPYLRYAETPQIELSKLHSGGDQSWFWEVRYRAKAGADGMVDGSLVLSGLTRSHTLLCYGTELLQLFRAYAWHLRLADPDVQLSTMTCRFGASDMSGIQE